MGFRRLAGVGVIAALAVPTALAGTTAKPAIHPLKTSPLTARGVHFKPHEKVRVSVVSTAANTSRRVVAGAAGAFTVTFTGVTIDRCIGYSLSAVGSFGDRATFKMLPPGCAPA
jgi:hypothetical protein